MELSEKLVVNVEIKSPYEVFFKTFGTQKYNLPKIAPLHVSSIDLLRGDWGGVGCTLLCKIILDGNEVVCEETIIDMDEVNKTMTYDIHGGDLMKTYKKMEITFKSTTKGDANYFTFEFLYEKLDNKVASLDEFIALVTSITNAIDAHNLEGSDLHDP